MSEDTNNLSTNFASMSFHMIAGGREGNTGLKILWELQ